MVDNLSLGFCHCCLFAHVWGCMCDTTNLCKPEDSFCDSSVFSYRVGVGDHIQVVGLGGEHPYPLSLLTNLDGLYTGLGMEGN